MQRKRRSVKASAKRAAKVAPERRIERRPAPSSLRRRFPPLSGKPMRIFCRDRAECGKYFSDGEGKNEIAENSWVLPATEHKFINGDICECGCTRDTWGFEYELSADGAYYKLIGVGSVIGANVVVPSEYNGKNVLAIADDAFRDYVNLKTIIISDSVVTIGSNAFNNCTSMENIVIGSA